jgi:capsid protein
MTRRRINNQTGTILDQFAELKADYNIGKTSRYKRTKTGIVTTGSHSDYHYRTEAAYFGAIESAREMTRNNPLVMQGVRRFVANVVGRGFVLDADSGDKGIDEVNSYRWAEWAGSRGACDDQGEQDFHSLEKLTLQHVVIDGDLCHLPNRDGALEAMESHRLRTPRRTSSRLISTTPRSTPPSLRAGSSCKMCIIIRNGGNHTVFCQSCNQITRKVVLFASACAV